MLGRSRESIKENEDQKSYRTWLHTSRRVEEFGTRRYCMGQWRPVVVSIGCCTQARC